MSSLTPEEAKRGLLYYEQLLSNMAEELNVKRIGIDIGMYADDDHITATYHYDTTEQQPIGLELYRAGDPVDAPQTLLILLESYFDRRDA